MQDLLEDEDEEVRCVAEARIAVKSNIVETRAARYQQCAERGVMPRYVSYGAAHTFRMGGGDKMNWLNISSKHNENRPELSAIAASIMAPPATRSSRRLRAGGEARITALAGWPARPRGGVCPGSRRPQRARISHLWPAG
ncbi:MAG: hypothetical protein IPM06_21820 [Rhizobiales bacterium]|nr:hypothetical protein [Hyphomicrobiales bacterium]